MTCHNQSEKHDLPTQFYLIYFHQMFQSNYSPNAFPSTACEIF